MGCAGCGHKYPGTTVRRVSTPPTQPKVQPGERYVVKHVVPLQPTKQGAFPIGTKK